MLRVAHHLDEVEPAPSVVTIGVFDGVHRGHRAIIGRAVREAAARDQRAVATTFDRHPMEVIRPGSQPSYLQSLDRKIEALLDAGVDLVVVIPFTQAFSERSPHEFVQRVLAGPLQATKVVVGTNFRFGHHAAGDVVTLTDFGRGLGFGVEAVTLLQHEGKPISSTAVRDHLAVGDVEWAAAALGRPFVLEGVVVRGEGRGRSIGIATANLEVAERMQTPAGGVYACEAWRTGNPGQRWAAVVNSGTRPTFGGEHPTVEAHLLDADLDLYGDHLAIAFVRRLRDERRFSGPDELVGQIQRDIAAARGALDG